MNALWLTLCLLAVEPQKAIVVSGPETAKVSESVRLRLEGLPAVELKKTIEEQLAWISEVVIVVDPPRGSSTTQWSIDKRLTIEVSPFRWSFDMDFKAEVAGDYVVIVDWNKQPFELVHHRIKVGKGGPSPDPLHPSPDEPNPPTPDPNQKPTRVTYVYEKNDNSVPNPVAKALAVINEDGSGCVADEFERHTTDEQGDVPEQYKVALAAALKEGLPCLVVQSGGVVLRVVKEPKTGEQVMEALK